MDEVKDFRFGKAPKLSELVDAYGGAGFQATELRRAVELMRRIRKEKCTIFLSFTANMVASGLRGIFAQMVERGWVNAIITTGGSLDHDMIKAYAPYFIGSFAADDAKLHQEGVNRIGNILVPNDRYELLEEKLKPVFAELAKRSPASPSEFASEMGRVIEDEGSFLRQAYKRKVPVFSPGITDSAIGLQSYFAKQKHREFAIDVTKDMKALADLVLNAEKTAAIVLGGGISKHHTIGVNLLRGGLDYAIYVSTSESYDGSLSGAPASEAVSWGKISEGGKHVTVRADATLAFPLAWYAAQD